MFKINFKKIEREQKGFTLIETLVAVGIFSISILAVMAGLTTGLSDINTAKKKLMAEYRAQECIEKARNVRDQYLIAGQFNGDLLTAWSDFIGTGESEVVGVINGSLPEGFTRSVSFIPVDDGSNEMIVSCTVSWGTHSTVLSEHLFNWVK